MLSHHTGNQEILKEFITCFLTGSIYFTPVHTNEQGWKHNLLGWGNVHCLRRVFSLVHSTVAKCFRFDLIIIVMLSSPQVLTRRLSLHTVKQSSPCWCFWLKRLWRPVQRTLQRSVNSAWKPHSFCWLMVWTPAAAWMRMVIPPWHRPAWSTLTISSPWLCSWCRAELLWSASIMATPVGQARASFSGGSRKPCSSALIKVRRPSSWSRPRCCST